MKPEYQPVLFSELKMRSAPCYIPEERTTHFSLSIYPHFSLNLFPLKKEINLFFFNNSAPILQTANELLSPDRCTKVLALFRFVFDLLLTVEVWAPLQAARLAAEEIVKLSPKRAE